MTADAFVSYANLDRTFVDDLCAQLRSKGAQLWIDTTHLKHGEAWAGAVQSAIASSRVVILVVSPSWRNSPHCESELEWAHGNGKRLVAVLAPAWGERATPVSIRIDDVAVVDARRALDTAVEELAALIAR
jgi:TIR domain